MYCFVNQEPEIIWVQTYICFGREGSYHINYQKYLALASKYDGACLACWVSAMPIHFNISRELNWQSQQKWRHSKATKLSLYFFSCNFIFTQQIKWTFKKLHAPAFDSKSTHKIIFASISFFFRLNVKIVQPLIELPDSAVTFLLFLFQIEIHFKTVMIITF